MCIVPSLVLCHSDYLVGGPQCLFEFLFEPPVVEASVEVIFPHGSPQHRGLCVVVEGPGFHLGVEVFEVVEFLHPAPKSGARCQSGLGLLFRTVGFFCGVGELCHEE